MKTRFALLLFASAAVASCQTSPTPPATATVDSHAAMVAMNPAATVIWDVTNNAVDGEGRLDASQIDEGAWERIRASAEVIAWYSHGLADAPTLEVGDHSDDIEGFATTAEIQAMIDANPDQFRALSRAMANHADELAAAAAARDLQQMAGLADSMSEHCQACHTRYWEKPAS